MSTVVTEQKYVDSGTPGDGTEGLVIARNILGYDDGVTAGWCSEEDRLLTEELGSLGTGTNLVVHKGIETAPCSRHLEVNL